MLGVGWERAANTGTAATRLLKPFVATEVPVERNNREATKKLRFSSLMPVSHGASGLQPKPRARLGVS